MISEKKLGCGAAMASLVRTQVDRFQLEDALTLERIEALQKENELKPFILPVDQLFEYYDKIVVADKAICYLQNGNKINAGFCQGNIPGEDGKKCVCTIRKIVFMPFTDGMPGRMYL